ncbi:hypothetical protein [Shewanella putrefaciens]|uniref:hypothetical protein n=1 Tax=Shewanella putrefaciens TaxID=24 RepID=UPI0035654982
MERVVQLSSVNLNTSTASVIKFLMDKDRPIFFRVPDNKNPWVIKRGQNVIHLKEFIKEIITNARKPTHYRDMPRQIEDKSNLISEVKLINGVCYGCLETVQIPELLTQKKLIINTLAVIMTFSTSGELILAPEISLKPNMNAIEDYSRLSPSALISVSCSEIVFTNKTVEYWAKDNSTLNDIVGIDITFDSLAVYESDIINFIHNDLDSIPDDSPYYIPKELRGRSKLDQLAVFGFLQFETLNRRWGNSNNLALKLKNQLGYKQTMAESAAFFINVEPRGQKGTNQTVTPNGKYPNCQFPFLVEALSISKILGNDGENKVSSDVVDFLGACGFRHENCKYGELLVRYVKAK